MNIYDFDFEKLYSLIHDETDRTAVKMFVEDAIKIKTEMSIAKIKQTIENNIKKSNFELWQEKRIKELDEMKRRGVTPEEIRKIKNGLVEAGIIDENGELTEPYRLE